MSRKLYLIIASLAMVIGIITMYSFAYIADLKTENKALWVIADKQSEMITKQRQVINKADELIDAQQKVIIKYTKGE